MASRRPRTSSPKVEFPILDANGLYAVKTRGDGNCLFNALSDQLYGHQDHNGALRDATIAHMRVNADFYRQYMTVGPSRRNPKRQAAAAASSTCIDTSFHSEEELQRQFDLHVEKMGQPGEWADNMEVSAFASALNVHVRLWQADYTYTFSPPGYYVNEVGAKDDRAVLNIAYHTWEHYSSVRNNAGPHTGPPNVTANPTTLTRKRCSVEWDDDDVPAARASKRRSPLPLFDSDTPESYESSSDESNPSSMSSQSQAVDTSEPPQPHPKLTIKLRNTRLTTTTEVPPSVANEPLPQATTPPKAEPAAIETPTITTTTVEPTILIDLTTDDTTDPTTDDTTETPAMTETTK